MKSLYVLFLCCFISCTTATKPLDPCSVDAGIKKAKIHVKSDMLDEDINVIITVEYTKKGDPLKVFNAERKSTINYVYIEDTLKYIITSAPDYFFEGQPEEEIIFKVDTLFITKNDVKGRMLESRGTDSVKYEYSYVDCNEASVIEYSAKTKVSTIHLLTENGNIMKKTAISHVPVESTMVSNYMDYKFDKYGHWIERSLQTEDGEIFTEARTLEYY